MATFTTAVPEKPYFLQAASGDPEIAYSAADFRGLVGAIWGRTGIVTPESFLVSAGSPVGWTIKVAPGYARVAGSYLVRLANEVTVNLNAINKNPSSTRTHKVWLAVFDKLIDGNVYTAKVVVTEDTNGSGAPDVANAAGVLRLATITVNSGQSYIQQSNITNSPQHTWMGTGASSDLIVLRSGFTDSSASYDTGPLRAIYHNGQVTLRGTVNRTNDAAFAGGSSYNPVFVNSPIRPTYTTYGICAAKATSGDQDIYVRVSIAADGFVNVRIPTGYNPTTVFLDGFTYFLD